ncbi:hypothetical protein F66182_4731 [Fusarium sp. NRRL 66182]|nr:hypothetical protein F66182_4731 [Fusarium sp. NRRL 66182]
MMSPFIEALALMPRDTNDSVLNTSSPSPRSTLKIVAATWASGWMVFGVITVVCINSQGRAGRWVPEWYLDSEGSRWDKLAVAGWWICVLLFWPVIWIGCLVKMIGRGIGKGVKRLRGKKSEGDKGTELV